VSFQFSFIMKIIGEYLITDEVLGQGEFSEVRLAISWATKARVAVKIYDLPLTEAAQESLSAECRIETQSSQIVGVVERYKSMHACYLVMDYCAGGSLKDVIRAGYRVPEDTVKRWSRQLIEQLKELRETNVVHRDLKPANVLLDRQAGIRSARICDFSRAREAYDGTIMTDQVGTAYYQAPEVLNGKAYDYKVDVWSLGVTLAELLLGECPFAAAHDFEKLIWLQQQPLFHYDSTLSPLAQSFLLSMLQCDPLRRPDFDQIRSHPFLQEIPPLEEDLDRGCTGWMDGLELQTREIVELLKRLDEAGASGIARTLVSNCVERCRRMERSMTGAMIAEKGKLEAYLRKFNSAPEASIAAYQETANSVLVQALVITAACPRLNRLDTQAELRKAAALLDLVEQRDAQLGDWLLPRQTLIRQLHTHLQF